MKIKNFILLITGAIFLVGCSSHTNLSTSYDKGFTETEETKFINKFGISPIHLFVRINEYSIVEELINRGANINVIDFMGDTPLLNAARKNKTKISKLLLCSGANADIKDVNNLSPLYYAKKHDNKTIIEMLNAKDLAFHCNKNLKVTVVLLDDGNSNSLIEVSTDKGNVVIDKFGQSTTMTSINKAPLKISDDSHDENLLKFHNKKVLVTVVLLDDGNSNSLIDVSTNKGNVVIDKFGQSTTMTSINKAPLKIANDSHDENLLKFHNDKVVVRERKYSLNFDLNSADVNSKTEILLEDIYKKLKSCKSCNVIIKGHTDTLGSNTYNMKLSTKRAENIKELIEKETNGLNKVTVKYYGEETPLVETEDEVNNESNRRVDVLIYKRKNEN